MKPGCESIFLDILLLKVLGKKCVFKMSVANLKERSRWTLLKGMQYRIPGKQSLLFSVYTLANDFTERLPEIKIKSFVLMQI